VIRLSLLDQPPPFLIAGAKIGVMRGAGEHAGMIRVVPNGLHPVARTRGPRTALAVLIPPLGPAPAENQPAVPVEFDYADTWLDVTLPAWARAPAPAPRVVAVAPGAPKATGRNPFAVAPELREGARA
jgi:hypothetical protein